MPNLYYSTVVLCCNFTRIRCTDMALDLSSTPWATRVICDIRIIYKIPYFLFFEICRLRLSMSDAWLEFSTVNCARSLGYVFTVKFWCRMQNEARKQGPKSTVVCKSRHGQGLLLFPMDDGLWMMDDLHSACLSPRRNPYRNDRHPCRAAF